jgi:GTPase
MGGSTKFFKTTVYIIINYKTNTLTSNYFNYLFLLIAADKGINQQTESLINIVNSLRIPFIIIFTKIDLITEQEMKILIKEFKDKIAMFKIFKNVVCIKEDSDVELFSRNLEENVLPLFQVIIKIDYI